MPATSPRDNHEERELAPRSLCTDTDNGELVREIRVRIDHDRERERFLQQRIVVQWQSTDPGQRRNRD